MPTMCSLVTTCYDMGKGFSEPFLLEGDSKLCSTSSADANNNTISYTLLQPNRSKQTWRMDVDFPELGQPGHEGQKGQLTSYLQTQFPDLYQPTIVLADIDENSYNTISHLVDKSKTMLNDENAMQTLRGYAKDLGISGFTIKWYRAEGEDKHKTYTMPVTAK